MALSKQTLLNHKQQLFTELNKLRHSNGFFSASDGEFYKQFSWWRDNFYACLPYLENYPEKYVESYHSYLDQFKFFETKYKKLSCMRDLHSTHASHYVHARVLVETMDEVQAPWANKQNDAVSQILIGICMGENKGLKIIRNEEDRELVQLIIDYLIGTNPTVNPSSDIWEEEESLKSSTIGLCKKAFMDTKALGFNVPQEEIDKCDNFLELTLPAETNYRRTDLSLLVLPLLGITDTIQSRFIIRNVEKYLLREHGVIRYIGDRYYNNGGNINNTHSFNDVYDDELVGNESAWCFGFGYLSCIYEDFGYTEMCDLYLEKLLSTWTDGRIPELVFAHTDNPNDNRVLAWSNAMTIMAIDKVLNRK